MFTPEEISSAKNGLRGIASHRKSAGVNRKNCGKFISALAARLNLNPILKVLSSIRTHRVQALLMGGQAYVLYGAAEFSRDTPVGSSPCGGTKNFIY